METIDLQSKAIPKCGRLVHFWFSNPAIDLPRTKFHRFHIPFKPFDSGLDYVSQPEETELRVDWIELSVESEAALAGLDITSAQFEDIEASIYLGWAHNPVDLLQFRIADDGSGLLRIDAIVDVDFEYEGVAANERFAFTAQVERAGEAQQAV